MAKTPEQRLESRTVRELKKEIIKLRREKAEMRKRLSRIENDFDSFREDLAFEAIEDEQAPEVSKDAVPCPKCDSSKVNILELRGIQYYKCLSCESKGRIPQ